MVAYHVVTDRPMYVRQQIIFDGKHHSGVYQVVKEINANLAKERD